MKTKKLKSLGLDEAIKVNTLAQAKYFIEKLGWCEIPSAIVGKFITRNEDGCYSWTDSFIVDVSVVPASDFIKPKKSKFKKLEKRLEALEKSQKNTIKLSKGLECDAHKERTDTEKMEDGVWYKNEIGLFLYKSSGYTYGFVHGKWEEKLFMAYHHVGDNTSKATTEEVKSALIKEAERRGLNINNLNLARIGKTPSEGWLYQIHQNALYLTKDGMAGCAFDNGKWAEILPNEEETIDWSKAGQLVVDEYGGVVIVTETTAKGFSGTVVKSIQGGAEVGFYWDSWFKDHFKPFKGELTLKNE